MKRRSRTARSRRLTFSRSLLCACTRHSCFTASGHSLLTAAAIAPLLSRNASGTSPALVANPTYEGRRDVLHTIENSAGGTVVSSYTYAVNPISQRTSVIK